MHHSLLPVEHLPTVVVKSCPLDQNSVGSYQEQVTPGEQHAGCHNAACPFRAAAERCTVLSFEATNASVKVKSKARCIVCVSSIPLGTCLSRAVFGAASSDATLLFAVKLDKLQAHTVSIGFVAVNREVDPDDDQLRSLAGRTMVGSRALAPGRALMLNPGYVAVVVGGEVVRSYPIPLADGAVAAVTRDSSGRIRFAVDGVWLPDDAVPPCEAAAAVRVGVSLTARGQRVSFPTEVDTSGYRKPTRAEIDGHPTAAVATQYDGEVVSFAPQLLSAAERTVAVGGDYRMLRCVATAVLLAEVVAIVADALAGLLSFAAGLASGLPHILSQQQLSVPDDDVALPIFINVADAAFGVGLCRSGDHQAAMGVWVRPVKGRTGEPSHVVAELWDSSSSPSSKPVAAVTFEHDLRLPVCVHFTVAMGFDDKQPLADVIVSINDHVCGPVAVSAGKYRAALIFTEAAQEVFLGMTPPDFAVETEAQAPPQPTTPRRTTTTLFRVPMPPGCPAGANSELAP